jgi:hypothetical protein
MWCIDPARVLVTEVSAAMPNIKLAAHAKFAAAIHARVPVAGRQLRAR